MIYNESCLDTVKHIERESIDMVILDPFFNEWDKYVNMDMGFLRNGGIIVAFSNRPHTGRLQVEFDKKYNFITEVVWNFADGRWVSNNLPRITHENILIYSKGVKSKLMDMRLLEWIDKPKQSKKGGASIGKWKTGSRTYSPGNLSQVESVIYCPRNMGKAMGAVSKPLDLIRLLIKMTTKVNDIVYDPFVGSGTTVIACQIERRRCIGSEISKELYDKAVVSVRMGRGLFDWDGRND